MREIIDVQIHPIKALTTKKRLLCEMKKANVIKGVLLALDVDPLALEKRDIFSEVLGRIMGFSIFADPERIFSTMRRMLEGAVNTNQK